MYEMETIIAVGLGAIIIGIAIGLLIAQRTAPSRQSQRELENHLTEMQQQQQNYQHEVTEHFAETSQLLDQLAGSYRDVHNHLAKGAQILAGESAADAIQKLPDDNDNDETPTALENHSYTPPLDYAPKATPHEPGMLNEEFGLDKNKKTGADDDETAPTSSAL